MAEAAKRGIAKLLIPVIALIAIAGFVIWRFLLSTPKPPENLVFVSGRIEGDESAVASKTTGRLREIRVREGDQVSAGDLIAFLDDDQIRAREEQAQAAVAQAQARVHLAQRQIGVLNEQYRQAEITVGQSRTEAHGRVREAEASVAAAEANLAQAEAAYKLALYDRDAYTKLAATGAVSERRGREAQTSADTQAAVVASAQKRVEAARGTLAATQSNLKNPDVRSAQAAGIQAQILQAQADIAAAQAEAQRARAQLDEARANRKDLQVLAPFNGTVATRAAEPGEVAVAGSAIITLVDLTKVYLRGYVPEGQIGRVKLGQPVRVYIDSNPSQPLRAQVSRIDPQASFTPENTYFREDRVKQVVGVKLQLLEGAGFAKPGMPADGEILVEGSEFPDGSHRR
jgi:HlyD family secretion protein